MRCIWLCENLKNVQKKGRISNQGPLVIVKVQKKFQTNKLLWVKTSDHNYITQTGGWVQLILFYCLKLSLKIVDNY